MSPPTGYAGAMWFPLLGGFAACSVLVGTVPAAPESQAGSDTVEVPYDLDPWSLVRVEVPDHPDAVATSATGSLLLDPPDDDTPWRYEAVAEPDLSDSGSSGMGTYDAHEAAEALQVDAWHEAGWDGSGVRVAVFDPQWFDASQYTDELGDLETHDCWAHDGCTPPMDTSRPTYAYEEGVHGIACAEVIRDLAPGVELHAVKVSGYTTYENAVQWAIREQIDLVSMSLSFYNESFYDGTGAVSALIPDLAAADVLMVTSSGNSADEHWMESFRDDDLDAYHEFPWGSEYLPVYLYGGGRRRIYASWDQYANCGETDLDLFVYDDDGQVVGRSEDRQDPGAKRCEPEESVSAWAEEDGWYYVQVRRAGGSAHVRFAVWARSGTIWQAMAEGSVTDPATHPQAFSVGAVRANDNYLWNGAEYFSSCGPTHGGDAKPDIAGPNGLSTAAYGETGFYGTSASTPAVTAALALVLDRYPSLSPYEAAERLQGWAQGTQATWEGPDTALGAGYARLPSPESTEKGCGDRPLLLPILFWLPLALRRRAPSDPP